MQGLSILTGGSGGLSLSIYEQFVQPLLYKVCGTNKIVHCGVNLGIAALTTALSSIAFGGVDSSMGFMSRSLNPIAQIAFSASLDNIISTVDEQAKTHIVSGLEWFGLEEYEDYVDGTLQIAEGIALGQVAKAVVNMGLNDRMSDIHKKMIGLSPFKSNTSIFLPSDNALSFDIENGVGPAHKTFLQNALHAIQWPFAKITEAISGGLGFINTMLNTTPHNEGNFISNALHAVSFKHAIFGGFNLAFTLFNNVIMGSNKAYGLSVYDIRKIIKCSTGDDIANTPEIKEQIKALAAQQFSVFKRCEEYIAGISDPDRASNIDMIIDLHKRCFSNKVNEQYTAIMQDTKLLAKVHSFVDATMEADIINQLLEMEECKNILIQMYRIYPIKLTPQNRMMLGKMVNVEIEKIVSGYKQQTSVSAEEEKAIHDTFYQPSLIKCQYMLLQQKLTSAMSQNIDDTNALTADHHVQDIQQQLEILS